MLDVQGFGDPGEPKPVSMHFKDPAGRLRFSLIDLPCDILAVNLPVLAYRPEDVDIIIAIDFPADDMTRLGFSEHRIMGTLFGSLAFHLSGKASQ
jgi:hypothetical protein